MQTFGLGEVLGLVVMVGWIVAYYRWLDAPLRKWLGQRLGVTINRGGKYWHYDAPVWKGALLMGIELSVRFAVVLLPIVGVIVLMERF